MSIERCYNINSGRELLQATPHLNNNELIRSPLMSTDTYNIQNNVMSINEWITELDGEFCVEEYNTLPEDIEVIVHCRGEMNGFYGKKHIGAALENARTAFKGRKHTKETLEKMSKADKSYMKTEEYRKTVSEGLKEMYKTKPVWNKGKTGIYSAETLKKMSEKRRKYHEHKQSNT